MAVKTMSRIRAQFNDYTPDEMQIAPKRKADVNAMLTRFGELSRFKDFRRQLTNEVPHHARPYGFVGSDKQKPKQAESRNLQMWKLRRLEKKRLWMQDIVIACQGLLHNWERYNPFRSFEDQVRRPKRPAAPPSVVIPVNHAVRMRPRHKPLSSRLRAS